jgi:hypothetical protein
MGVLVSDSAIFICSFPQVFSGKIEPIVVNEDIESAPFAAKQLAP